MKMYLLRKRLFENAVEREHDISDGKKRWILTENWWNEWSRERHWEKSWNIRENYGKQCWRHYEILHKQWQGWTASKKYKLQAVELIVLYDCRVLQ